MTWGDFMISDKKIFKKKVFTALLTILTIAYIFFIWIHSFMSAEASTVESTSVLNFVQVFLRNLGFSLELTDHIIRKAAHFCEFALLGALVLWNSYLFNKSIIKNILSCGFICLATATIDEYIQLFSPGRAGMVTDIILDFSGVIAGYLFFILVYCIYINIKNRERGKLNG